MIRKLTIFGMFIVLSLAASCKKSGGGGSAADESAPAPEDPPPIERFEEPKRETETEVVESEVNFGLTRLTPEQYSTNLRNILNFETNYLGAGVKSPFSGREVDFILDIYGVPLGGIDYVASIYRDPSTKAQTVLIARQLAWQLSTITVNTEAGLAVGSRHLFKDYDIDGIYERPFMVGDELLATGVQDQIRDGEERWQNQIKEMYWRFFSRPASDEDLANMKTAFSTIYKQESDDNRRAWAGILYVFLSAQEFWYL